MSSRSAHVEPHHLLPPWPIVGPAVPDAQRDEKIVEGCGLYATAAQRAKAGERIISSDELTGVQALERKHPDLPMQLGHVLRREFE